MDVFFDMLKGFFVGLAASVPMGPIAFLVVQKTLSKGQRAGFFTGLGASVVDTLFAVVAIFIYALVDSFIKQHENEISLIGGVVLVLIGLSMALSNPLRRAHHQEKKKSAFSSTDFLQAIAMGLTNPGALALILWLFGEVGINNSDKQSWNVAPIILSVSAGTVFYWFAISWLLNHFRSKISLRSILWFSRVMGALVIIFGVGFIGVALFKVCFKIDLI